METNHRENVSDGESMRSESIKCRDVVRAGARRMQGAVNASEATRRVRSESTGDDEGQPIAQVRRTPSGDATARTAQREGG